jgi:hypothetical protein
MDGEMIERMKRIEHLFGTEQARAVESVAIIEPATTGMEHRRAS